MYRRFPITYHPSDRVVTQGSEDDIIVLSGKAALRLLHWKGVELVVLRYGLKTMVQPSTQHPRSKG
jgi:hypothetical protein